MIHWNGIRIYRKRPFQSIQIFYWSVLSNLAANEMFREEISPERIPVHIAECETRILDGVAHLLNACDNLVIANK